MQIKKVTYSFVVYLALIEGFSLFVMDLLKTLELNLSFLVGFIPAFIVLLLYKFTSDYFPVKINKEEISKTSIVLPSIANGLFIVLLFYMQELLLILNGHMFVPIYGFFSVMLAFLILLVVYNVVNIKYKKLNLSKVSFKLGNKTVIVNEIGFYFAIYAGIFEFFILPLMSLFYITNINVFFNGFISGLLGSTIALILVNYILSKRPLKIE